MADDARASLEARGQVCWSKAVFARPLAVGEGPSSGPDWLATALGFWYGRVLATGTARAGLYLFHRHQPANATVVLYCRL